MVFLWLRLIMTALLISADTAVDPGVEFEPVRSVKARMCWMCTPFPKGKEAAG